MGASLALVTLLVAGCAILYGVAGAMQPDGGYSLR
jgi:hypothetical protein